MSEALHKQGYAIMHILIYGSELHDYVEQNTPKFNVATTACKDFTGKSVVQFQTASL